MKHFSVDFLQFLPLEAGKTYAFVGDVAMSTEALVLFDEKTSKLEDDVCVVETTDGATIIQAVRVRDARIAVDNGLFDGVVSFNSSNSTIGHVKSLTKSEAFFIHIADGNRKSFDAVKGK